MEEQDASLPVTQLPAATDAGRDTRPAPAPDSTRRDSSTAPRDTSAPDSRSPRAEVEPADSRPRDGQAPESPSCGIEVRCGEVEVNTCTDKDHCGGCNHQCPDSAGFIWCKRGHCATEPPSGTCESCRLSVLSGNCCPYGTKFYCTDAKSCDDYPFP